MKIKYSILVGVLILLGIVFEYYVVFSQPGTDGRIGNAIQSAAVFVALVSAIIALSAVNPKVKSVKVKVELSVDSGNIGSCRKSDLPLDLKTKYQTFPDPITSHRVQFKIKNASGFT